MRMAVRIVVRMSKAHYEVDASNPNRLRIKVPDEVFTAALDVLEAEGRRAQAQIAINRLRVGRP